MVVLQSVLHELREGRGGRLPWRAWWLELEKIVLDLLYQSCTRHTVSKLH